MCQCCDVHEPPLPQCCAQELSNFRCRIYFVLLVLIAKLIAVTWGPKAESGQDGSLIFKLFVRYLKAAIDSRNMLAARDKLLARQPVYMLTDCLDDTCARCCSLPQLNKFAYKQSTKASAIPHSIHESGKKGVQLNERSEGQPLAKIKSKRNSCSLRVFASQRNNNRIAHSSSAFKLFFFVFCIASWPTMLSDCKMFAQGIFSTLSPIRSASAVFRAIQKRDSVLLQVGPKRFGFSRNCSISAYKP